MRITVEWYAPMGQYSTCMISRHRTFEGETRAEIDAQIQAAVQGADYQIVGLHNCLADFAAYETLVPGAEEVTAALLEQECPTGFADSPARFPPPAPKGWFRRQLELFGRRFGRA